MGLPKTILFLSCCAYVTIAADIPCDIEWIPSEVGSVPNDAVEVQPNEYIARVPVTDTSGVVVWQVTKFDPRLQKVSVVKNDEEQTFSSYEILTNPRRCNLKWVTLTRRPSDDTKEGLVPVGKSSPHYFVGRGKFQGYIVSGTVDGPNWRLIGTHHKSEIFLPQFELLVSWSPQLFGSLVITSFGSVASLGPLKMETVGSSLISKRSRNAAGTTLDEEEISHRKTFREEFIFQEDTPGVTSWYGISQLTLSADFWFDSPDLVDQTIPVEFNTLKVHRSREVSFTKKNVVSFDKNLAVCTYFLKPDPARSITFEGEAKLTAKYLHMRDLVNLVQLTGRTVLETESTEMGNYVKVKIVGTLQGRYALATGSNILDYTGPGDCYNEGILPPTP